MQSVTFLPRPKLHNPLIANIFNQPFQNLATQTLPRHFASAEENSGFYLVAFF